MELYLRGEGVSRLPIVDGSLSPLMIGVVIDRRSYKDGFKLSDLDKMAEAQARKKDSPVRSVVMDKMLVTGIQGKHVSQRVEKDGGARVTFNETLVWLGGDGKPIGMTAFLSIHRDSETFAKETGLLKFIEGFILMVAESHENVSYKLADINMSRISLGMSMGMAVIYQANELVLEEQWDESIELFEKGLSMVEPVHAAHNGLGWALMKRNRNKADLKKALTHAERAVELTGGLSAPANDTLKTVEKALARAR